MGAFAARLEAIVRLGDRHVGYRARITTRALASAAGLGYDGCRRHIAPQGRSPISSHASMRGSRAQRRNGGRFRSGVRRLCPRLGGGRLPGHGRLPKFLVAGGPEGLDSRKHLVTDRPLVLAQVFRPARVSLCEVVGEGMFRFHKPHPAPPRPRLLQNPRPCSTFPRLRAAAGRCQFSDTKRGSAAILSSSSRNCHFRYSVPPIRKIDTRLPIELVYGTGAG